MISQASILILDPFKNLLDVYRIFLGKENFWVETASSLGAAIQKLQDNHYAVLISEFLPPFEETFQMLQGVKEQSHETYIIIVTNAVVDDKTYERLFDIGVDDLILKPYSAQKILTHVKKGFRHRNMMIHKQELERASLTDPITLRIQQPIFNPGHFRKCLRQELKRAKRHQHPLSLLLLEVPGDGITENQLERVLIEVIETLRIHTREEDVVGRENGRFGILLPETDDAGSQAVVKRLLGLFQSSSSFQTEESLRAFVETISFRTFTYPDKFSIPEPLSSVLAEISRGYTQS